MGGKVIIHNAKSAYVTPLDVYINGQKIGHIKHFIEQSATTMKKGRFDL